MNSIGLIYKAWNKISGKIYVGQTTQSLKERCRLHYKFALTTNKNYKFSNALRKYSKEDWEWTILEENLDIDCLNEREIFYINKFDCFNYGYNSTPGGTERYERHGTREVLENVQELYNIKTCENIKIDAYNFIKQYYSEEQDLGNIYRFFKNVYLRYKDWVFLENLSLYQQELIERKQIASERFSDKTIYTFFNTKSEEYFTGTRQEFMKQFNLVSKGIISQLINGKTKSHKGWILKQNESKN